MPLKTKSLWLLVCDDTQGKIYSTTYPPKELALIYHQVNFGGQVEDLAINLDKHLNKSHRMAKFDRLAVMASSEFLAALDKHMNTDCRGSVVGKAILDPGQHTSLELVSLLLNILANEPRKAGVNGG